eukprot:c18736_g1_i1 orf=486-2114(+)
MKGGEIVERMKVVEPTSVDCGEEWARSEVGWLSPRISFSRDFAMQERVSPEKRKRDGTIEEDVCDSEFEFCMSKAGLDLQPGNRVLTADELFFNGKLLRASERLPRAAKSFGGDFCEGKDEEQPWTMARHLNYENSRCSSMSFDRRTTLAARRCYVGDGSSCCVSPIESLSSSTIGAATSPKASKQSSNRFREFFKLGKMLVPVSKEAPSAAISRERNVSSSCRMPVSPRSFWPFSRSISAGESKTTQLPPILPRRSNSAGENKTTISSLFPSKNHSGVVSTSTVTCSQRTPGKRNELPYPVYSAASHTVVPNVEEKTSDVVCRDLCPLESGGESSYSSKASFGLSSVVSPSLQSGAPVSSALERDGLLHPVTEAASVTNSAQESVKQLVRAKDSTRSSDEIVAWDAARVRNRGCGSSVRVQRRGIGSPARNFTRGSPGKRAGPGNGLGRANSARIPRKNVEKCGAVSKALRKSQDFRKPSDSYGAGVRVTPVLNVLVCMGPYASSGKASKSGLLNFGKFFSKEIKSSKALSTVNGKGRNEG